MIVLSKKKGNSIYSFTAQFMYIIISDIEYI